MQLLPNHAYFTRARGQAFILRAGTDSELIEAELQHVEAGVPLNEGYECFFLLFLLPPGVVLQQATYRLTGPHGESLELLLTPIRPDDSGRNCLEAIVHREKIRA
ncbi:MAG: hypothetical protein HWE39_17030 [Oceanospirillaceae bacterium]|nr:hypothetical protein [Oceanospirillaceae bacterium]